MNDIWDVSGYYYCTDIRVTDGQRKKPFVHKATDVLREALYGQSA